MVTAVGPECLPFGAGHGGHSFRAFLSGLAFLMCPIVPEGPATSHDRRCAASAWAEILAEVVPRKLKGNFLSNKENRNRDFLLDAGRSKNFIVRITLGHRVNSLGLTLIRTCRGALLPITYGQSMLLRQTENVSGCEQESAQAIQREGPGTLGGDAKAKQH